MITVSQPQPTVAGVGWFGYVDKETFTLVVDDSDETAQKRAIESMHSWTYPDDWTGVVVGEDDMGWTVWVFEYEPQITSW